MSGSSREPLFDNPNSPKIPHSLYIGEKGNFAGNFVGATLYGIIVVLLFQCTAALFNPINRTTNGIRWGLVSYTVAVFSSVTIYTAINLNILSGCYIDNREFPAIDGVLPPGPFGYQAFTYSGRIESLSYVTFLLNNWLADGLLLYRCCVIYDMNYWVIVFPSLMYLASIVMGVLLIYKTMQPGSGIKNPSSVFKFGVPYFSISVSLNVILTLVIVVRLVLHIRNIRRAIGAAAGGSRSYKTIVTMLVESSAIYFVSSLLYTGPWSIRSHFSDIVFPILVQAQVIAPLLIILRVADRRALKGTATAPGNPVSEIRFGSQGKSTGAIGTLDEHLTSSAGTDGGAPGEHGVGFQTETTIDEVAL